MLYKNNLNTPCLPEFPVLAKCWRQLLTSFCANVVPLGGVIAPRAIPLMFTPRIANAQQNCLTMRAINLK